MKQFRVTLARHNIEEKKILNFHTIDADDLVQVWYQLGLIVMQIQSEMQTENLHKIRMLVEGDIPF